MTGSLPGLDDWEVDPRILNCTYNEAGDPCPDTATHRVVHDVASCGAGALMCAKHAEMWDLMRDAMSEFVENLESGRVAYPLCRHCRTRVASLQEFEVVEL